jgi:hypothetical protein
MFITQEQLAKRWNLSPRTLERWRTISHEGPKYFKIGRGPRAVVRYHADDIIAFERENKIDPLLTQERK